MAQCVCEMISNIRALIGGSSTQVGKAFFTGDRSTIMVNVSSDKREPAIFVTSRKGV